MRRPVALGWTCWALCLVAGPQSVAGQDIQPIRDHLLTGVVSAGPDSVPRSGVLVELHKVNRDSGGVVATTVSGEAGVFQFTLDSDMPESVFLAVARHAGVAYFGPAVHFGSEIPNPYIVQVFDTTMVSAPRTADILARRVIVRPGAGLQGATAVSEVIDVLGPIGTTYVRASSSEAVWLTLLPSGAQSLRAIPGGLAGEALDLRGDTLAVASSLSPVGFRIAVSYRLPPGDIRFSLPQFVREFVVLVAGMEGSAEVEGFERATTTVLERQPYQRFVRDEVEAQTEIRVHFLRSGEQRTGAWLWFGIGGLLLAAAWLSGRSRIRTRGVQPSC